MNEMVDKSHMGDAYPITFSDARVYTWDDMPEETKVLREET